MKKKCCLIWLLIVLGFSGCMTPGENVLEFVPQEHISKEPENDQEEISSEKEEPTDIPEKGETDSSKKEEVHKIYVDVSGEVNSPGVYILEEGSRVFQAIEAAGGVTQQACMQNINQARRLSDEDRVWIPDQQYVDEHPEMVQPYEVLGTAENIAEETKNTDKINLNTASVEELMTLNGIGKGKAEAIVTFREERGSFQSIEQVMEIEGIKEGTFQKIKDRIYVG